MADSICPKCNGMQFESVDLDADNINIGLLAIQCARCGAIVGVLEQEDLPSSVESILANHRSELDQKLADLKSRLSQLGRQLDSVVETLQQLKK